MPCLFCGGDRQAPDHHARCDGRQGRRDAAAGVADGPPVLPPMRFNGADYTPERDDDRLTSQLASIVSLMRDGRWRTLAAIAEHTGHPEASISAQLRHLRKERFGAHTVNRTHLGGGLYRYQLVLCRRDGERAGVSNGD